MSRRVRNISAAPGSFDGGMPRGAIQIVRDSSQKRSREATLGVAREQKTVDELRHAILSGDRMDGRMLYFVFDMPLMHVGGRFEAVYKQVLKIIDSSKKFKDALPGTFIRSNVMSNAGGFRLNLQSAMQKLRLESAPTSAVTRTEDLFMYCLVLPPVSMLCSMSGRDAHTNELWKAMVALIELHSTANEHTPEHFSLVRDAYVLFKAHLATAMQGKFGLPRQGMMGKRVNYSGRTVLASNSLIPPTEVRVPYFIMREWKSWVKVTADNLEELRAACAIGEAGYSRSADGAWRGRGATRVKVKRNGAFAEVKMGALRAGHGGLPELPLGALVYAMPPEKGSYVIVNRQPSNTPYSMIALEMTGSEDHTITINPVLLSLLQGDCDGDEVNVHYVDRQGDPTIRWQIHERMSMDSYWLRKSTGRANTGLVMDSLFGAQRLSRCPLVRLPGDTILPLMTGWPLDLQSGWTSTVSLTGLELFTLAVFKPLSRQAPPFTYRRGCGAVVVQDNVLMQPLTKGDVGSGGALITAFCQQYGGEMTSRMVHALQLISEAFLQTETLSIGAADCDCLSPADKGAMRSHIATQLVNVAAQSEATFSQLAILCNSVKELANEKLHTLLAELEYSGNQLTAITCSKGGPANIATLNYGVPGLITTANGSKIDARTPMDVPGEPLSLKTPENLPIGLVVNSLVAGLTYREVLYMAFRFVDDEQTKNVLVRLAGALGRKFTKSVKEVGVSLAGVAADPSGRVVSFNYRDHQIGTPVGEQQGAMLRDHSQQTCLQIKHSADGAKGIERQLNYIMSMVKGMMSLSDTEVRFELHSFAGVESEQLGEHAPDLLESALDTAGAIMQVLGTLRLCNLLRGGAIQTPRPIVRQGRGASPLDGVLPGDRGWVTKQRRFHAAARGLAAAPKQPAAAFVLRLEFELGGGARRWCSAITVRKAVADVLQTLVAKNESGVAHCDVSAFAPGDATGVAIIYTTSFRAAMVALEKLRETRVEEPHACRTQGMTEVRCTRIERYRAGETPGESSRQIVAVRGVGFADLYKSKGAMGHLLRKMEPGSDLFDSATSTNPFHIASEYGLEAGRACLLEQLEGSGFANTDTAAALEMYADMCTKDGTIYGMIFDKQHNSSYDYVQQIAHNNDIRAKKGGGVNRGAVHSGGVAAALSNWALEGDTINIENSVAGGFMCGSGAAVGAAYRLPPGNPEARVLWGGHGAGGTHTRPAVEWGGQLGGEVQPVMHREIHMADPGSDSEGEPDALLGGSESDEEGQPLPAGRRVRRRVQAEDEDEDEDEDDGGVQMSGGESDNDFIDDSGELNDEEMARQRHNMYRADESVQAAVEVGRRAAAAAAPVADESESDSEQDRRAGEADDMQDAIDGGDVAALLDLDCDCDMAP